MKPEDQITLLARFDGYLPDPETKLWYGLGPGGEILAGFKNGIVAPIPNYLSDLNAIRPLLLKLSPVQQQMFANYVADFADFADNPEAKTRYDEEDYFGFIEVPADFSFKMLTLSPELLCKALLKTLKLWA